MRKGQTGDNYASPHPEIAEIHQHLQHIDAHDLV